MFERWNEIELEDHNVELRQVTDIIPEKNDDTHKIVGYNIESIQAQDGEEVTTPIPTTEYLSKIGSNPKHLVVVDNKPVRTVSSLYTPVQDSQIHNMVMKVIHEKEIEYEDIIVRPIGSYKTFGQIILDRDLDIFGIGEGFDYSLVWSNSIDGSMGIRLGSMWVRMICSNGMMAVHKDLEQRLIHVQSERDSNVLVEKCENIITSIIDKKQGEIDMFNSMRDASITPERILWIIKKLHMTQKETTDLIKHGLMVKWEGGKLIDVSHIPVSIAFEDIVVTPTTEWGFFNALTNVAQSSRNMERELSVMRRALNLIISSRYAMEMEQMLTV